ncbi:DUF2235 domain-containing protein [Tateyamaria sp. SN6-1]|uniref:DUF2235 domain-containing protein n=1 Tax=Tateyamaria sp. SN6-1 TaxID=3092148 RepID=UPI0039F648BC
MKRIVVLCDGTWNSPDIADTTHLPEMAISLDISDQQVVKYFSGVGVNDDPRFETLLGRGVNRILGGATGLGLGAKVKAAYTAIAQTYEDGDEIYLFGFSRGAFTARSVAGMIRKCGIIDDLSPRGIRRAFRLYRRAGAGNAPDAPGIQAMRAAMSPRFATSERDRAARPDPVPIVRIAYLGVWDTVGARGIPTAIFGAVARLWNRQYRFHDMMLSRSVVSARHAVAADERRRFYEPALWENIAAINGGDTSPSAPYQQQWFVGDHAILGGSAMTDALSVFPKLWVLEGAPNLTWRARMKPSRDGANHLLETNRLSDPGGVYRLARNLLDWRKDPRKMTSLNDSTAARLRDLAAYRPESLRRFF